MQEYWDIVDAEGRPTGRTLVRNGSFIPYTYLEEIFRTARGESHA